MPLDEAAALRLQAAREIAQASRDAPERKGDEALVNQWREVSKPRKGGMIKPKPPGSKVDFPELFQRWLQDRGLEDALEFSGEQQGWRVYKYIREPVIEAEADWETAFHGTWWYAVWMVLHTGIFLESNNKALGHDFWEPGVYCSPNLDTGIWYARPQILFGDGVSHRVICAVKCDAKRRKQNRKRGGVQWVFPGEAVALHAVWVRSNAPPANGEERVNSWQPELEALPLEWSAPPQAIVNPRKDPWPFLVDQWAWDFEGESNVPPWMRSTVGGGKKAAANQPSSGSSQFGGLYGHWIKDIPLGVKAVTKGQAPPYPARGSLARTLEANQKNGVAASMLNQQPAQSTSPHVPRKVAPRPQKPGWNAAAADWSDPAWGMSSWCETPDYDAATMLAAAAALYGWAWDGSYGPPGKRPRW
jgi:hypothetical protein